MAGPRVARKVPGRRGGDEDPVAAVRGRERSFPLRRKWITPIGLAVVAVLLWWLLRDEDPAEVWSHIRAANPWLLLLAVAVTTATFPVRAIRWRYLLEPSQQDSPYRSRFAAVCIGFMANNLLPRVGELARAYAYSKREPVTAATAFGTLVVERFLDAVAILALLLVALASPGFPADGLPPEVVTGIRLACLFLGVIVIGSLVLLGVPERSADAARRFGRVLLPPRLAEGLASLVQGFAKGLEAFRGWRLIVPAVIWSLVVWTMQALSFWIGFLAFDIRLGYDAALFTNGSVAFASLVPTPGFFGTFHAAVKLSLADLYGVAEAPALGFAFGWHLGGFLPITLMGLWYLRSLGVSLRAVTK